MKKQIIIIGIVSGIAILPVAASAADPGHAGHQGPAIAARPYPLKTCIVSGEKLGGEMGKPYVFTYQGREIQLCCKNCLTKFNNNPAKFIKTLEQAGNAAKHGPNSSAPAHSHGSHQH